MPNKNKRKPVPKLSTKATELLKSEEYKCLSKHLGSQERALKYIIAKAHQILDIQTGTWLTENFFDYEIIENKEFLHELECIKPRNYRG